MGTLRAGGGTYIHDPEWADRGRSSPLLHDLSFCLRYTNIRGGGTKSPEYL